MSDNYISGSLASIKKMADFDFKFHDALKHNPELILTDDNKAQEEDNEYTLLADYFRKHHIETYAGVFPTYLNNAIQRLLMSVIVNAQNHVTFTQMVDSPYYFKISNGIYTLVWCPAVLTRALLFFLKSITVKCEAFKRHKSHIFDKNAIIFMELALTGKTSEEVPEALKTLAKACKAIKER